MQSTIAFRVSASKRKIEKTKKDKKP